jgi:hypothetical protein
MNSRGEKPRSRVVLNSSLAIEIYRHKIDLMKPMTFSGCLESSNARIRGESTKLAKRYSVSAKTIRDIWNRKSWASATAHLRCKEVRQKLQPKVRLHGLDFRMGRLICII